MWEIQLFDPGRVVMTPGVEELFEGFDLWTQLEVVIGLLVRHTAGDWGELGVEDLAANDHAVVLGERVLSAYRLPDRTKVWVITEADRSSTTILLPGEY